MNPSDLLDSMADRGQFKNDIRMRKDHHIWCNHFHGSPADCRQCHRLWGRYPYDESKADGVTLAAQYFPDATVLR